MLKVGCSPYVNAPNASNIMLGEIAYGSSFFEWFAGEAVRNYGDVIPAAVGNMRNIVIKQGVGACAVSCRSRMIAITDYFNVVDNHTLELP